MQSSMSSPNSLKHFAINGNPKNNFQQNKRNKPEKPTHFRIRESKASIL